MKFNEVENGNLVLESESDEDKQLLKEIFERVGYNEDAFMDELLEDTGLAPNGRLYRVNPEDVGALTSSTILNDDIAHNQKGEVVACGSVWWTPDYAVLSWIDTLLQNGSAVFKKA